ncbi:hypothetical protein NQ315_017277, partial [Exocentrus adspersus]
EVVSTTGTGSNTSYPVTLKTVLNSTDCTKHSSLYFLESNKIEVTTVLPVDANEINKLADVRITNFEDFVSTTSNEEFSVSTTEDNTSEFTRNVNTVNATLRDVPNISNVQPDIEAILNLTKQKTKLEDYDYDYNEPSLPPSLPNVRIIPFVAADALDAKKELPKENTVYPSKKVSDASFGYTNLFSPPIETEGGFIPKDPPLLDNFYENVVTVPSITLAPKQNNDNCVDQEGREVLHGQSVASDSPCTTCTCFYRNIVCQKPTCSLPRPGCRKSPVQDITLCCPLYVCDAEAPTVVLDRMEESSNSQEILTPPNKIVTPDPFRDVIRTEPAPNLQSLIVDMMPFLARKTTAAIPQFLTEKPTETVTAEMNSTSATIDTSFKPDAFSLDKVLDILFPVIEKDKNEMQTNQVPTTVARTSPIATSSTTPIPSTFQKSKPVETTPAN